MQRNAELHYYEIVGNLMMLPNQRIPISVPVECFTSAWREALCPIQLPITMFGQG
jgi:hypothetical protein